MSKFAHTYRTDSVRMPFGDYAGKGLNFLTLYYSGAAASTSRRNAMAKPTAGYLR